MASPNYLQAFAAKARSSLPDKLLKQVHFHARGKAGGMASKDARAARGTAIQPVKPVEIMEALDEPTEGKIGGTIRDGSSEEKFVIGGTVFDIDAARDIAGSKSNGKVAVSLDWSEQINVDGLHALQSTASRPIFMAMMPTPIGDMPLLIDGHHRMFKAAVDGIPDLPCYVFKGKELSQIMMARPDIEDKTGVGKGQPGPSNVHVPTADWRQRKQAALATDPPLNNDGPTVAEEDHITKIARFLKALVSKDELTTEHRNALQDKTFALPKERKYPIHDISHARNALARASGKPEEAKVKRAVYSKYPKLNPVNKDTEQGLNGVTEDVMTNGDPAIRYNAQHLVEGADWEMAVNGFTDETEAIAAAVANLQDDPNYYSDKWLEHDATDDVLKADAPQGVRLDLGSGQAREPRHIGLDLYPHDYGTLIHDVALGLPFPNECASHVRMVDPQGEMDPKAALSEVARVLMPGGQFLYQGPNQILNAPEWMHLDQEETNEGEVEKDGTGSPFYRQVFSRLAYPDAASADDAEPRIGVSQYDQLPADALMAMNAMSYYSADASTSGRGNRAYGYASQGALATKSASVSKVSKTIPIFKSDPTKQIAYGVVLTPDEVDAQEDWMTADDIESTAHNYLEKSRAAGADHERVLKKAFPVESYIAPVDFEVNGQYGKQLVKKGSWVLGMKIVDPDEWEKVASGEYQAFSVGGLGLRDPGDRVNLE